jgi:hypothetical protein
MLPARMAAVVRSVQQEIAVPLLAAVVCAMSGGSVYLITDLIEDCSEVCNTACNSSNSPQVHTCCVALAQCLLRTVKV